MDLCRIATVDSGGFPHCVPVSYLYDNGLILIATVSSTKKVRNIRQNPECCVLVDVGGYGRGRGLMLQGRARLVEGVGYLKVRRTIEGRTGWRLDEWKIEGRPPDSAIVFRPTSIVDIGRV